MTPAYRLTASCIWSSFRSSGKRHLFLTGSRGSGKTTLLNALFPEKQPGLTTWAEPKKAVYLRENMSGETVQAGAYDASLPGPGNQMVLLRDGFSSLGVPTLARCEAAESPWVTIDEIGYLEAQCADYHAALRQLLGKKQVAAVIRKQVLPFLQEMLHREDAFVADLDEPFGSIGCVIMASGLGRRFGGNKLMADFAGQPLISRILNATEGIFTQRVVVTRHADVARLCEARGIRTVLHDLPYRSDTVRLGLEVIPGVDRCMFTPADQPLLRQDTVASLALASANAPERMWRPSCDGIPGSPVVFPQWAFAELQNLPEGKGGGVLVKKYPERLRTVNVRDMDELRDVDSPEDLQALLER